MSLLSDEDFTELVSSLAESTGYENSSETLAEGSSDRQELRLYMEIYQPLSLDKGALRFSVYPDITAVTHECQALQKALQELERATARGPSKQPINLFEELRESGGKDTSLTQRVQAEGQAKADEIFGRFGERAGYRPSVAIYAESEAFITHLQDHPWRSILTKHLQGKITKSIKIFVADSGRESGIACFHDPDVDGHLKGALANALTRCDPGWTERKEGVDAGTYRAHLFAKLSEAFAKSYILEDVLSVIANDVDWQIHDGLLMRGAGYRSSFDSMHDRLIAAKEGTTVGGRPLDYWLEPFRIIMRLSRFYPMLSSDPREQTDVEALGIGEGVRKVPYLFSSLVYTRIDRRAAFKKSLTTLVADDGPLPGRDICYMSHGEAAAVMTKIEGNAELEQRAQLCRHAFRDRPG